MCCCWGRNWGDADAPPSESRLVEEMRAAERTQEQLYYQEHGRRLPLDYVIDFTTIPEIHRIRRTCPKAMT